MHNALVLRPIDTGAVARSHCMFANVDGRCFLIDRGSRSGTFVDGVRVGGMRAPSRVELPEGRCEVAIGGPRSAYRFRVTVTHRA